MWNSGNIKHAMYKLLEVVNPQARTWYSSSEGCDFQIETLRYEIKSPYNLLLVFPRSERN